MSVDERRNQNQPFVSSHRITKDHSFAWPQVRLQSPVEMRRAVGLILWKTAYLYMAAFAGMVGGFLAGVLCWLLFAPPDWFGLAILVRLPFWTAGAGGLLLAYLAWKEQT